jgi:glycerol-3-phosphate dehydrogenase
VHDLAFVVPNYDWWEAPFYGLGLKLYQLLAGKHGLGPSRILSREETLEHLPTLKTEGLRGGAVYYDGQFDDARLLIHMAATACELGATLLNYVEVIGLTKNAQGHVNGISARDAETGEEFQTAAKVVINATGPFSDRLRLNAEPDAAPMIAPSQGIHLVFDGAFPIPGMAVCSSQFRGMGTHWWERLTRRFRLFLSSRWPWTKKSISFCLRRENTSLRLPRGRMCSASLRASVRWCELRMRPAPPHFRAIT